MKGKFWRKVFLINNVKKDRRKYENLFWNIEPSYTKKQILKMMGYDTNTGYAYLSDLFDELVSKGIITNNSETYDVDIKMLWEDIEKSMEGKSFIKAMENTHSTLIYR